MQRISTQENTQVLVSFCLPVTYLISRLFFSKEGKAFACTNGLVVLKFWVCQPSMKGATWNSNTHESDKQPSGKLIPKIGGVCPREGFRDICVLETNLQQGEAALVPCTHGVSNHAPEKIMKRVKS